MDLEDAVPGYCPGCGAGQLERASGAAAAYSAAPITPSSPAQAAQAANPVNPLRHLDPDWPWFLQWSVFLFAAVACALLAAMAVGAADGARTAGGDRSPAVPVGISLLLAVGLLGLRNTRRNRVQARRLGSRVHAIHEHAVYCRACSCVHFAAGDLPDLPDGLVPDEAVPLTDYRARLWQACGYVRRL